MDRQMLRQGLCTALAILSLSGIVACDSEDGAHCAANSQDSASEECRGFSEVRPGNWLDEIAAGFSNVASAEHAAR